MPDQITMVIAVAVAILAILTFVTLTNPAWRKDYWAIVVGMSAVITAAAAVSIPLAIDSSAKSTRTLEQLNELDRKIAETIAKKIEIEKKLVPKDIYSEENLRNVDVEPLVFRILNEYVYMCLGANMNILDNKVILRIRRDALLGTWRDYGQFIKSHRARNVLNREAWVECDRWIEANNLTVPKR